MSNKRRDARRASAPRRRPNRVFTPAMKRMVAEGDEIGLASIKALSLMEMDAIRNAQDRKACPTCGNSYQPIVEYFHKSNTASGGWFWECKGCRKTRRETARARVHDLVWSKSPPILGEGGDESCV